MTTIDSTAPVVARNLDSRSREFVLAILALALTLFVANIPSIFALAGLIQDDNQLYLFSLEDRSWGSVPREMFGLSRPLSWLYGQMMEHWGISYTRLFLFWAHMVPLSALLYLWNRRYLALPVFPAFLAAFLANAVAHQYLIPAFVTGSYPVVQMIAFILGLILVGEYLRAPSRYGLLIMLAGVWLIFSDVGGEMSIFLALPALAFIWLDQGNRFSKIAPTVIIVAVTLLRLGAYLYRGGDTVNTPVSLSAGTVLERIEHTLQWWWPVPTNRMGLVIGAVLVTLVVAGYMVGRRRWQSEQPNWRRSYVFYAFVLLAGVLPFWFMTRFFDVRHLYTAYIGLSAVVGMSLYNLGRQVWGSRRHLEMAALAMLVLGFVVARYSSTNERLGNMNTQFANVAAVLRGGGIPEQAQIAVVGSNWYLGGWYQWSSGWLAYALERKDIRGLIGAERSFYDPFDTNHQRDWKEPMAGLDIAKPLLAFKWGKNHQLLPVFLFLRWQGPKNDEGHWTLYRSDPVSHMLSAVAQGVGLAAYEEALGASRIERGDVLWGGAGG